MSVALFVLGAWVFASVALGLLLGWACGLNKLSRDADKWPLGDGRG